MKVEGGRWKAEFVYPLSRAESRIVGWLLGLMNAVAVALTAWILFVSVGAVRGEGGREGGLQPSSVVEELRILPALPKTHYNWPFPGAFLDDVGNDELLSEYVRIAGAVCVWGEWVTEAQLFKVWAIARAQGAELGLVFRPWQRKFPADAPPTYRGPEWLDEVLFLVDRLFLVRGWLVGCRECVAAVILECERFTIKDDDDAWNAAVTENHRIVYQVVKYVFPEVRVEWYKRGGTSPLFTGREPGSAYSVPLYTIPERGTTRDQFRRTSAAAGEDDVDEVTPWVSLSAAYRRNEDGTKHFDYEYSYDPDLAWLIGAEINNPWYGQHPERFAPWNAACVVIFWPAPFDARIPDGHWGRCFVEYVKGANGIRW